MTRLFACMAILLYSVAFASAATLYWNGPQEGTVDIEKKDATGAFVFVERVNANPPKYTLPTGAFGDYRLSFPGGQSNAVTYSADIDVANNDHAAICRAAKAMGGSATTFAGRIRKELGC